MMTLQQVFDRVAKHLLTQMMKALDASGNCSYRTPDGLKCAVGCLIPDEAYIPEMETLSVYYAFAKNHTFEAAAKDKGSHAMRTALEGAGIDCNDSDTRILLDDLQSVHDNWEPDKWFFSLADVATRNNLSFGFSKPQERL